MHPGRRICILVALLVATAITGIPAQAKTPPFDRRDLTVDVVVEKTTFQLPATVKTRRLPDAQTYNTDLSLDVDMRRLYAKLPRLIAGVKRNDQGQTLTLSNVRCSYAKGRLVVQSTADYRQALTGGLDIAQTLHSTIALYPEFEAGVLQIKYVVRDAAFEGLTQGLLEATGTDPRTVVKALFDLYFKEELSYPLPDAYRKIPIRKKELRLYAREGQFFGLRAAGSAQLSQAAYEDLLKQFF